MGPWRVGVAETQREEAWDGETEDGGAQRKGDKEKGVL